MQHLNTLDIDRSVKPSMTKIMSKIFLKIPLREPKLNQSTGSKIFSEDKPVHHNKVLVNIKSKRGMEFTKTPISNNKLSLSDKDILVAGHKKTFSFTKDKKEVIKHTNFKEFDFYREIRQDPKNELNVIIPKTYELPQIHNNQIKMENLMLGFTNPKILDLKIGHTHVCRDELKRQGYGFFGRSIRKIWANIKNWNTGASIRGWRVCGGTGVKGNKLTRGKNSEKVLKNFFERYSIDSKQVENLREEIVKIKSVVKNSEYAFIDSSILVVMDNKKLNVKLIDFAYPIKQSENKVEFLKHKKSFEVGIDNLISELSNIA